jgi:hypothetical protein
MTALKFRKRPVVIEAMQWTGENTSAVIDWVLANGPRAARWHEADEFVGGGQHIAIDTLEGTMRAVVGDWIIRGVQDEFYPCKPDIFEATYEAATEA